jgi:hypothetical protein
MILMVLLNDGSDLIFHDLRIISNLPKSTAVIYFMIHASGVSNLKPCFLPRVLLEIDDLDLLRPSGLWRLGL